MSRSDSRRTDEVVVLPKELRGYARYLVVLHPEDSQPYSIGIRHVLPTQGVRRILQCLLTNQHRSHKKPVQGWLCKSVVRGTSCPMRGECDNVHVTEEGYGGRRLWNRPIDHRRTVDGNVGAEEPDIPVVSNDDEDGLGRRDNATEDIHALLNSLSSPLLAAAAGSLFPFGYPWLDPRMMFANAQSSSPAPIQSTMIQSNCEGDGEVGQLRALLQQREVAGRNLQDLLARSQAENAALQALLFTHHSPGLPGALAAAGEMAELRVQHDTLRLEYQRLEDSKNGLAALCARLQEQLRDVMIRCDGMDSNWRQTHEQPTTDRAPIQETVAAPPPAVKDPDGEQPLGSLGEAGRLLEDIGQRLEECGRLAPASAVGDSSPLAALQGEHWEALLAREEIVEDRDELSGKMRRLLERLRGLHAKASQTLQALQSPPPPPPPQPAPVQIKIEPGTEREPSPAPQYPATFDAFASHGFNRGRSPSLGVLVGFLNRNRDDSGHHDSRHTTSVGSQGSGRSDPDDSAARKRRDPSPEFVAPKRLHPSAVRGSDHRDA